MKYYIGIDGGGTKTAFCLLQEDGSMLSTCRFGSASYKQVGVDGVMELLEQGISELLEKAQISKEHEFATCFGMPCMGESKQNDKIMLAKVAKQFKNYNIKIVNDCEVGWAASLVLEEGINIVAGTGSIAFGKNQDGKTASAGGWNDYFSDEGSCKWMGMKCMELFSKESDGRLERGALYEVVREYFKIEDDIEVIDIFEAEYQPYRDKTASLQILLKEAALKGDKVALGAYDQAGYELALIILALYRRLGFANTCKVSYSGGLFKTENLILEPLKKYLQGYQIELVKPQCEPLIGAGLLAKYYADGQRPEAEFVKRAIVKDVRIS